MSRKCFLWVLFFCTSVADGKSCEEGRRGQTIVTYDSSDFHTRNGVKSGTEILLGYRNNGENVDGSPRTRRHWNVFNYIAGCVCRGGDPVCCPVQSPAPRDLVLYGPNEDFSGKGKLQVYLDLQIRVNFGLGDFDTKYVRTHRAQELEIKKNLVRFKLIGNGLQSVSMQLGFDDFKCNSNSSLCFLVLSLDDHGAFMRTEGDNPTNIELLLEASGDLVSITFKKAEFVWTLSDR